MARRRLRRLRAQGREAVPGSDDGAFRPRARVVDGEGADAVPPLRSLWNPHTFLRFCEYLVRREAAVVGSGGSRRPGCGGACTRLDADAVVRHRLIARRPTARRHARLRRARALRPPTRRRGPLRSDRTEDRRRRGCDRGMVALARRHSLAAVRSSRSPARLRSGHLDITDVELPQAFGDVSAAFNTIRLQLASLGFDEPEKSYLVYYDGPTGQSGRNQVCGQGAERGGRAPGIAIVYLDSCGASEGDTVGPVVAAHEFVHTLGAVNGAAPPRATPATSAMSRTVAGASLTGEELDTHVLDGGHDDYYGHSGSWPDVQDSFFLERLDSPDRERADHSGRARREGRSQRARRLLVARIERRRRPRRLPPLRERAFRPRGSRAAPSCWTHRRATRAATPFGPGMPSAT